MPHRIAHDDGKGDTHFFAAGAAWKKVSQAERPYPSVTLGNPSCSATIYPRLIEEDDGTHNLIRSCGKSVA